MNQRLDKWLWVARFFKTRSLAQQAILSHKVRVNAQIVKPAYNIKINDFIEIAQKNCMQQIKVLAFHAQRQKASLAQLLYEETSQSIQEREKAQQIQQLTKEPALGWRGRPEKKQRRALEKWLENF